MQIIFTLLFLIFNFNLLANLLMGYVMLWLWLQLIISVKINYLIERWAYNRNLIDVYMYNSKAQYRILHAERVYTRTVFVVLKVC